MSAYRYLAGKIVEFSRGEYSDYTTCGLMVTLQDIKLDTLALAYREEYKPKGVWDKPSHDGFMGWLVAKQYMAPIDYDSIHLGSYDDWDI